MEALYVRNTLAVRPFMKLDSFLLTSEVYDMVVSREGAKGRGRTNFNSVEQWVTLRGLVLEDLDIPEDALVNLNTVVVANGVFAEEVENKEVWRFEGNVFVA